MNDFISEMFNYNIKIPLAVRMAITIILLIVIVSVIFIFKNEFSNDDLFKENYKWWAGVAIFNLICITIIMYYYENIEIKGIQGLPGKRGGKGERGKYITCSFCTNNLFVKRTKRYNEIVNLADSVMTEEDNDKMFEKYNEILKSYQNYNIKLDKLDIYEKKYTQTVNSIDNMLSDIGIATKSLIDISQFMVKLLIKQINNTISQGNTEYPGSFHNVIGSFPIGDTVFSNDNNARKLNAFMVDGDIRHPLDFKHRTTFYKYQINELGIKDAIEYSVWTPNPPKGYKSLGDIVVKGNKMPRTNIMACLNDNCLDKMNVNELELVFVYHGIDNELQKKVSRGDSMYKVNINNEDLVNSFRLYSVWRTPLNTMYIKTTNNNDLTNDTVISNILGPASYYRDKFGLVKRSSYSYVKSVLIGYQLPLAVRRLFIVGYYSEYYLEQLENHRTNFINSKYYHDYTRKLEELKREYDSEIISKREYDKYVNKYNEEILRDKYNIIKENYIKKLKEIDKLVKTKKSLYDILYVLIPGGFDTQIYINDEQENGNGGLELSLLQKQILILCKVLFPPNRIPYMIKNECLSFTRISKERRGLVKRLGKVMKDINYRLKLFDDKDNNDSEGGQGDDDSNSNRKINNFCEKNRADVYKYKNMIFEYLDRYTSHIKDGMNKIKQGNYDDFTDSRLKVIVEKMEEFKNYFDRQCSIDLNR